MTGQGAGGFAGFADWYATAAPRLLLTLRAVVGDDGLAEEATAEAFARAYARWPAVSAMASPGGWVYVVALNQVRSWTRRRRLERRYAERERAGLAGREPVTAPAEVDDALWSAVRELPPRARTAVALRYLADLSEEDVARLMGVTRGTVAATLHRARTSLAAVLRDEYEENR
ncbi:MAG TPA: sigma-70 family RNA polymerase sigma factor [Mycobacteriales bacterium]|nr:sigma-70 family RNA polymerase sigma factor [Mycobacteriales bacterium]